MTAYERPPDRGLAGEPGAVPPGSGDQTAVRGGAGGNREAAGPAPRIYAPYDGWTPWTQEAHRRGWRDSVREWVGDVAFAARWGAGAVIGFAAIAWAVSRVVG